MRMRNALRADGCIYRVRCVDARAHTQIYDATAADRMSCLAAAAAVSPVADSPFRHIRQSSLILVRPKLYLEHTEQHTRLTFKCGLST